MNHSRRTIAFTCRIALRCIALLWIIVVLQMPIGAASAAAPAVSQSALTCEGGTAGLKQLCLMADVDHNPSIALLVPSERLLEASWRLYVQTHMKQRRPPTLLELAEELLVNNRDIQTYVDALLADVKASDASAPDAEIRRQLGLVALCPLLLVDDATLQDTPPCTFVQITPRQLTHRALIVRALNRRKDCLSGQPCLRRPELPTMIITTLADWRLALAAEMGRLDACRADTASACVGVLMTSTAETAALLASQMEMDDWLNDESDRCLAVLASAWGISSGNALTQSGQPEGMSGSVVAALWQDPDQLARRHLRERIERWREHAAQIRAGTFNASPALAKVCLAPVVQMAIERVAGPNADVMLDPAGHLPDHVWKASDGWIDFRTAGMGPLAAMRLRYGPVQADRAMCRRSPPRGALTLVVRYRDAKGIWRARELESGVRNVQLPGLCLDLPTVASAELGLSNNQLQESLRSFVPPPFQLSEVKSDLTFRADQSGPGRLILTVSGKLGVAGTASPVPVTWALGDPSVDLSRAAILRDGKQLLVNYLKPRLGVVALSLTPPAGCPGLSMPAAPESTFVLYSCLQISPDTTRALTLPAVLAQIEFDGSGGHRVRFSHTAMTALREAVAMWLEATLQETLRGTVGAAAEWHVDVTATGVRFQVPAKLMLADGVAIDWTVGFDVPFSHPIDLKGTVTRQLRGVLEQQGDLLAQRVRAEALQRFNAALKELKLPGIRVDAVEVDQVKLTLSLPFEGLQEMPVTVQLDAADFSKALAAQILAEVTPKLPSELRFSGLVLKNLAILGPDQRDMRWRLGAIAMFDSKLDIQATVVVPLDGKFVPDVKVRRDDVLRGLASLAFVSGGSGPVELEWLNGIPQFRIRIKTDTTLFSTAQFEGEVSAVLTQAKGLIPETFRATSRDHWVPVSFIEIGNFEFTANLQQLAGTKFSARAAVARAQATQRLLRLDGVLTIGEPIQLDVILTALDNLPVGSGKAVLDTGEKQLTLSGKITLPLVNLDLGQVDAILDGQRCLLVARSNANILKLATTELTVGLAFADCPRDLAGAKPLVQKIMASCREVVTADLGVCASGQADMLGGSVSFHFEMPLAPLGSPVARAHLNVIGIELDTEIRKSFVRMHADAAGLASVTLILKPMDTLTKQGVARLLESALKPKLSWDAFQKREIVLSMFPPREGDGNEFSDAAQRSGAPATVDGIRQLADAASSSSAADAHPTVNTPLRNDVSPPFGGNIKVQIDCATNTMSIAEPQPRTVMLAVGVCTNGFSAGRLMTNVTLFRDIGVFCRLNGASCDFSSDVYATQLLPMGIAKVPHGKAFRLSAPIQRLFSGDQLASILSLWPMFVQAGRDALAGTAGTDWSSTRAHCLFGNSTSQRDTACYTAVIQGAGNTWRLFQYPFPSSLNDPVFLPVTAGSFFDYVIRNSGSGEATTLVVLLEQLQAQDSWPAAYAWIDNSLVVAFWGSRHLARLAPDASGAWKAVDLGITGTFQSCDSGDCPWLCTGSNLHEANCPQAIALVSSIVSVPGSTETCILRPRGISRCVAADAPDTISRSMVVVVDRNNRARVLSKSMSCLRKNVEVWLRDKFLTESALGMPTQALTDAALLDAVEAAMFNWRGRPSPSADLPADPALLYQPSATTCEN